VQGRLEGFEGPVDDRADDGRSKLARLRPCRDGGDETQVRRRVSLGTDGLEAHCAAIRTQQ
jgi:hypothetical protein